MEEEDDDDGSALILHSFCDNLSLPCLVQVQVYVGATGAYHATLATIIYSISTPHSLPAALIPSTPIQDSLSASRPPQSTYTSFDHPEYPPAAHLIMRALYPQINTCSLR